MKQLQLALIWNRIDVAKNQIFTENREMKWKVRQPDNKYRDKDKVIHLEKKRRSGNHITSNEINTP